MSLKKKWLIGLGLMSLIVAGVLLVSPGLRNSLEVRIRQEYARVRTVLDPPEQVSFSGGDDADAPPDLPPTGEQSPLDSGPQENQPVFAPVPLTFSLDSGNYFSQHNRWNYCGPASAAILASYWGWEGTHDDAASVMRTHTLDKNVMPYDMADYFRGEDGVGAIIRVGGYFDTLKRQIAAGFSVLIEKGPHFRDIHNELTWMGHYQVLTGYNDPEGYFIAQDPYIEPDYHQDYEELVDQWRSFNYLYLVAFPPHLENDVLNLLGADADEADNFRNALQKAQREIYETSGVQQFFAMYNYGTNLVSLRDYAGAAKAYDQAFLMYDALPENRSIRPYRILWYQTGPYFAYYYTGRYADVIEKATRNSIEMVRDDIPALEESWYWRGKAKLAIGDRTGGIRDLNTCLEYRNRFPPCIEALNEIGIFP